MLLIVSLWWYWSASLRWRYCYDNIVCDAWNKILFPSFKNFRESFCFIIKTYRKTHDSLDSRWKLPNFRFDFSLWLQSGDSLGAMWPLTLPRIRSNSPSLLPTWSCFCPEPVVYLSYGIFHSRLPPQLSLSLFCGLWTDRTVFWRLYHISKCSRLSRSIRLLTAS